MAKPSDKEVIEAVGGLPDSSKLEAVLVAGGNPNARSERRSALDHAVTLAYEDKVRALLRHGADPNSPEDPDPANDGRFITPLIDATRNDSRVGIVKLLLEAGANPNQFDDLGMTPLMCAASAGAIGVLNLLVASGANVMAETPNGKTALHFAMTKDNPEIVRCLVQLGLDPTKSSVRGGPSPLQLAQKRAHTAAISVLGELGFG